MQRNWANFSLTESLRSLSHIRLHSMAPLRLALTSSQCGSFCFKKGAKFIQGNVFEVTLSRNDERSPLRVKSVHYKTENSVSLQKLDADYLVPSKRNSCRNIDSYYNQSMELTSALSHQNFRC
jgi:hypothetical protein